MIGPLRAEEAAAAVALWQEAGLTRPWNDPHADLAAALACPTATILAARDGDALVGTVMVGWDGHRGWFYYLAVAVDHRRRGLGRALVAAAETWLGDHDAPKAQLMVRGGNVAAERFWMALGYERSDVAVFGRSLSANPAR